MSATTLDAFLKECVRLAGASASVTHEAVSLLHDAEVRVGWAPVGSSCSLCMRCGVLCVRMQILLHVVRNHNDLMKTFRHYALQCVRMR